MTVPLTRSSEILLVEDNHDIAENTIEYLEKLDYIVDYAATGTAALGLLETHHYGLLILDVMLPDIDGFSLAVKVRQQLHTATPLLFLTARDTLKDKLQGFSVGGDDYLTKPFALEELAARVHAVFRRTSGKVVSEFTLGPWQIDETHHQASYRGNALKLTRVGLTLLKYLAMEYPKLVPRSQLENAIWGDSPPDSDALRSHIFSLRKEISRHTNCTTVETVHGVGYRMVLSDKDLSH